MISALPMNGSYVGATTTGVSMNGSYAGAASYGDGSQYTLLPPSATMRHGIRTAEPKFTNARPPTGGLLVGSSSCSSLAQGGGQSSYVPPAQNGHYWGNAAQPYAQQQAGVPPLMMSRVVNSNSSSNLQAASPRDGSTRGALLPVVQATASPGPAQFRLNRPNVGDALLSTQVLQPSAAGDTSYRQEVVAKPMPVTAPQMLEALVAGASQAPQQQHGIPAPVVPPAARQVERSINADVNVEVEQLRRTMATQGDRLAKLTKELEVSRSRQSILEQEAQVSRRELERLNEELRRETQRRELAEASFAEQQVALELAKVQEQQEIMRKEEEIRASAAKGLPSNGRSKSPARGAAAGPRRSLQVDNRRGDPQADFQSELQEPAPATAARRRSSGVQNSAAATQRFTAKGKLIAPSKQVDEVDEALSEYLEEVQCSIRFIKKNRGWYSVRPVDSNQELGCVDISITNGKLMAKMESTAHHETGWNNGKLGSIDKFINSFGP